MSKNNSASSFLENMKQQEPEEKMAPIEHQISKRRGRGKPETTSRDGLKHIGGYLDDETVEKVAILRARLKLNNSELIALAVNELYSRQKARKAFND
jgi:hypothetical protein